MGCGGSKPAPGAVVPKGLREVEDPAGRNFDELYRLGKEIKSNGSSTTREGTHLQSGELLGIKVVLKDKLSLDDDIALRDEITALQQLTAYDNIIRIYDVFDEKKICYVVMEKMNGGPLFDRIVEKKQYYEIEAQHICKILFDAVQYIHNQHVIHRDIKPDNILLHSSGNDARIKITEFNFSKMCTTPKSLKTQCGTPQYVAPEILEGYLYDTQADMWSMGVTVYILLCGIPPFVEMDQRKLFQRIRKGDYKFEDKYWKYISDDGKELVSSLLTVNPEERWSASDVVDSSAWLKSIDNITSEKHMTKEKHGKNLKSNLKRLKQFTMKSKNKSLVSAVIAAQKITSLGINFQDNL